MNIKFYFILALSFSLFGCAQKLPTFAHVHVGHTISAWKDTPQRKGLFSLSEELATEIAEAAIEADTLAIQGSMAASRSTIIKVTALVGSADDVINQPSDYTFNRAFVGAVDHFAYAAESQDATLNLSNGLKGIVENSDDIAVRGKLLKELCAATNSIRDNNAFRNAVHQIRVLAVQNLQGGDGQYSLKQMRDDIANMLSNENPPYTVPENKYLFGVIRLPNGTWFWNFKDSGSNSSYGRYDY